MKVTVSNSLRKRIRALREDLGFTQVRFVDHATERLVEEQRENPFSLRWYKDLEAEKPSGEESNVEEHLLRNVAVALDVGYESLQMNWSYLPPKNNHFIEPLEGFMQNLSEVMNEDRTVVLRGPHGIGKTEIALQFGYKECNERLAVFWGTASSERDLLNDFERVLAKVKKTTSKAEDSVKDWLQFHEDGLLVIDNVEDFALVEEFVSLASEGKGRVLLTTRDAAIERIRTIPVPKMENDKAVSLLLHRANLEEASLTDEEREKAREIAIQTGGLPAELVRVANEICERGCSLSEYLKISRPGCGQNRPSSPPMHPGMSQDLTVLIEKLLSIVGSSEFHLASHYGLEPGAESLKGWLDKLRQGNPLLVVAIVGELNAGKSTLVNALLNRAVAFRHHFQATMTLAFYYPEADEDVRILYPNGTEEHLTIQRYLDRCRHPENIRQAQHVEVHVPSSLNFVLIDTPGMGSLDKELQERAEEAVKEADAIVWVIDPNNVGRAQEGAFLRRAKEIRLPILVVLSKVDALSDRDIQEAIGWVSRNLGYPLIPISAQNHLQSHNDPGVSQLTQKLIQMSADTPSIRALSQAAKEREMVDEAVRLVAILQAKLAEDLQWIDGERKLIRSQAAAVESHLQDFSRAAVIKHLRLHLVKEVPESLQPDEVPAVLQHSLTAFNQRVPELRKQLMQEFREETESVWKEQFVERQNDLQRKIDDLLSRPLEQEGQVKYLQQQLADLAFRKETVIETISTGRDASSRVGSTFLSLGGALVTYFAKTWWGPLVGGAFILIGVLLDNITRTQTSTVTREVPAIRFRREQFIETVCQEFGGSIQDSLKGPIHEYLQVIVDEALESMCQKKWQGLTVQRLEDAKREVDRLQGELTAVSRLARGE